MRVGHSEQPNGMGFSELGVPDYGVLIIWVYVPAPSFSDTPVTVYRPTALNPKP